MYLFYQLLLLPKGLFSVLVFLFRTYIGDKLAQKLSIIITAI